MNEIKYSTNPVCPKCNVINFIQDYYATEDKIHFQLCNKCSFRFIWKDLKRSSQTITQSMPVPSDTVYSNENFNALAQEEKAEFLADVLSEILPIKHKTSRLSSGVVVDRLLDLFDIVCLTKEKSQKVDKFLSQINNNNEVCENDKISQWEDLK